MSGSKGGAAFPFSAVLTLSKQFTMRRARMCKALVTLAVSMTGGAWILGALEPDGSPPALRPSVLLQATVREGTPLAGEGVFDSLLVVCAPQAQLSEAHLVIDAQGLVTAGPAWRAGRRLDGAGSALVVRLALARSAPDVSFLQYGSLETVLEHLCRRFGFTADRIELASQHSQVPDLARHLALVRSHLNAMTMKD